MGRPGSSLRAGLFVLTFLGVAVVAFAVPRDCVSHPITTTSTQDGYCVFEFATNLGSLRGIDLAPNGDLLVVDKNGHRILAVWEDDAGVAQNAVLFTGNSLNHAVHYNGGYIYASSDTTVWRWAYDVQNPRAPLTNAQEVITGIPGQYNHQTRTIQVREGFIYVSVASADNIDQDTWRARVIRGNLTDILPIHFFSGVPSGMVTTYADGLRNEVGLRMDPTGRLWGVENSIDNLGQNIDRFDESIYLYNPAEEVNIFTDATIGKTWGYPFCWTEGLAENGSALSFPEGLGNGTVWAIKQSSANNDTWCRTSTQAPVWALQAHSAPLDIFFEHEGFLPYAQSAVIVKHGSWNRPAGNEAGHAIEYLELDANWNPFAYHTLVQFPKTGLYRPVAGVMANCQSYGRCMFITDDSGANSRIMAVAKLTSVHPHEPVAPSTPTDAPTSDEHLIIIDPTLNLTWSISGGVLSSTVRHTGSSGWLSVGWTANPSMSGNAILVLNTTNAGTINVNDRSKSAILGSYNQPTTNWGYTNIESSITTTSAVQTLSFDRPLECAPTTSSGCPNVPTDGVSYLFLILAWHDSQEANIESAIMAKHSATAMRAVSFTLPVEPPQDAPTSPSTSPAVPTPADTVPAPAKDSSSDSKTVNIAMWAVATLGALLFLR